MKVVSIFSSNLTRNKNKLISFNSFKTAVTVSQNNCSKLYILRLIAYCVLIEVIETIEVVPLWAQSIESSGATLLALPAADQLPLLK